MAAGVEVIPSIAPPKGGAHHALPIPQPHSPASSSRHPLAGFEKLPISSLPLGIMSLSLGNPRKHSIDSKIIACASQGWQGIEIHMDDITAKARSLSSCPRARVQEYTPNREEMLASARAISALCKIARLRVICLEPFLHYPGLPLPERTRRLEQDLPLWFELSDILGTNLIQVASSMFGADRRPGVTGSEQRVVEDLLLLAKAGQRWHTGTKYFAYEAMCFGAYVRTWQQAWRQVELVDQENFGMVFDTFQMLGAAVADPALPGGFVEGWQDKLAEDVQQLRDTFVGEGKEGNRRKLFFCQLGDAKLPDTPLDENNPLYDPKQHANPKMAWSRSSRLFAGEGYLPVRQLSRVIFNEIAYRGWVTAEYFNLDLLSDDPAYPYKAAERCCSGHEFVLREWLGEGVDEDSVYRCMESRGEEEEEE